MKSVRLPADLATEAERLARELGLTFSDLVEAGLRRQIGWRPNSTVELLAACAESLRDRYPQGRSFPQDVTRELFREVQTVKRLRGLYDAAVAGPDGKISEALRDVLHRRVGKMVKAVLDAEVIGRSLAINAAGELIKTHALLSAKRKRAKP